MLVVGLAASFDALAPAKAAAQDAPVPTDLATMFELGNLVVDTNGDSIPDLVNATLVLGDSPSVAATAAAAEIAARLGFETMAMDLPIARGLAGDEIPLSFDNLQDLLSKGMITREEARFRAANKDDF